MSDDVQVSDNQEAGRFELALDGHTGVLEYDVADGRLTLEHTEVPEELGGQGVGGRLVRAAVTRAEAEGLIVVPVCPFTRSWLEKHPDVAASVSLEWPSEE